LRFVTGAPTFSLSLDLSTRGRIILVDLFGLRATHSIKVVIACLASPADPRDRTDYQMIQHFRDMGVHVLFVYAGSHGSASGGSFSISLHDEWLYGKPILQALARAHSGTQVVLCVDSCYSGHMIVDFQQLYASILSAAAPAPAAALPLDIAMTSAAKSPRLSSSSGSQTVSRPGTASAGGATANRPSSPRVSSLTAAGASIMGASAVAPISAGGVAVASASPRSRPSTASPRTAAAIGTVISPAGDVSALHSLPSITIVASTQHDKSAQSGWRFVNIINDMLATPLTRSSPERFAEHMVANLKTPMQDQRAQSFHHRHPRHADHHHYHGHLKQQQQTGAGTGSAAAAPGASPDSKAEVQLDAVPAKPIGQTADGATSAIQIVS